MLLGWLRGEKRSRYIQITPNGIAIDQFEYMASLPDTLDRTIGEQREKASIEFLNAVVSGDFDLSSEKEAIVEHWDNLAKRARPYLIDIGDELSKPDSALRVDQATSKATGIVHITLRSLDQWARREYSITILDDDLAKPSDGCRSAIAADNKPIRMKLRDQENAILAQIKTLGHDPKNLPARIPGTSGVKAAVEKALANSGLFSATTAYNKAWERLRKEGAIAESTTPHKK